MDSLKQAEALILGGLACQKTGIIFKVEEFRTTPKRKEVQNMQIVGDIMLPATEAVLLARIRPLSNM